MDIKPKRSQEKRNEGGGVAQRRMKNTFKWRLRKAERKGKNLGCKKGKITQEKGSMRKKTNGSVREEASPLFSETAKPIHLQQGFCRNPKVTYNTF